MAGLLSHTLRAHDENCAVGSGIQVWSPGVDHREWHFQRGASGQAGVELAVGQTNLLKRMTCTNVLSTLRSTATIRDQHQTHKQRQGVSLHMTQCTHCPQAVQIAT